MDPASVIVTGATGFIGGHLVARLLELGCRVHVPVRSRATAGAPLPPTVTTHPYDGSTSSVARMVERAQPGVIFHLAAYARTEDRLEDVESLVAGNVLFGTQLLQAAVEWGRPAFVNTGTYWQHRENREGEAVCLYAALKEAFEAVVGYHASAFGLRAITLTLYDTYGPGDRRGKFLQLLRTAAETGQPLHATAGTQRIEMVHVRDVVEAYLVAATRLESAPAGTHERFAVRTGREIVLRDFAGLVAELLATTIPVVWGAKPFRNREMLAPPHLPILPGWVPSVPLRDGLREVLDGSASGPAGRGAAR